MTPSRTGTATLPLHWGKAPPWLFNRMKRLARQIILIIIADFGPQELLVRLSDPLWFQALGCALGFDWHSSGLTTTVCGAIKEAAGDMAHETGFFAAGGKGRTPRKTPDEIMSRGGGITVAPEQLVYANSIEFLREMVGASKIEASDKQRAFKQLAAFYARGER